MLFLIYVNVTPEELDVSMFACYVQLTGEQNDEDPRKLPVDLDKLQDGPDK